MLLRNKILLMAAGRRYQNLLPNGNFSVDTNGDGWADSWEPSGANAVLPRLENGKQYWTPNTLRSSGSAAHKYFNMVNGHNYYLYCNQQNVKRAYIYSRNEGEDVSIPSISVDGIYSKLFTWNNVTADNDDIKFYGRTAATEAYIEKVILIDLNAYGLETKDIAWCNANIPQNIIW